MIKDQWLARQIAREEAQNEAKRARRRELYQLTKAGLHKPKKRPRLHSLSDGVHVASLCSHPQCKAKTAAINRQKTEERSASDRARFGPIPDPVVKEYRDDEIPF